MGIRVYDFQPHSLMVIRGTFTGIRVYDFQLHSLMVIRGPFTGIRVCNFQLHSLMVIRGPFMGIRVRNSNVFPSFRISKSGSREFGKIRGDNFAKSCSFYIDLAE